MANPFADAAFNDDWSYTHVALKLAETGRLHYNGWGSPTILLQSFWAAAWIRAAGFSFNLLRYATLPFSIGFVALTYALARKAGLAKNLAFFGTLVIATSPLFVPLAASFMTEPYACFFSALCLYAALSSALAEDSASARRWLWVLATSGVLGGSDRQSVWAAPITLIPYLCWAKRANRKFTLHALVSLASVTACMAFIVYHFAQPYAPLEFSRQQLFQITLHELPSALVRVISILLSGFLVCWPAILCFAPDWKRLGAVELGAWSAVSLLITVIAVVIGSPLMIVPFTGNILSPFGLVGLRVDALGFRPFALPVVLCIALTWLLVFSVIASGRVYGKMSKQAPSALKQIFAVFVLGYSFCILPGIFFNFVYDRYLLPVFPVMVIVALLSVKSYSSRVPIAAWAGLLIFTGYSVATTHDYFSVFRLLRGYLLFKGS